MRGHCGHRRKLIGQPGGNRGKFGGNLGESNCVSWMFDKKGYIEDRRPNANMDPYTVTRLLIETVCG